jgi:PLD-like domain
MKIFYVPLYRNAVSYLVNIGRRWSLLEQLLLIELGVGRRTVKQLALSACLSERLIVEALINLMQAGWIEVVSTGDTVVFDTTVIGKQRSSERDLPVKLYRDVRWISLCCERLTGSWHRSDEFDLVYDKDLPDSPSIIDPLIQTCPQEDGAIRDLLRLDADEALEPTPFQFKTPSRPYARITLIDDRLSGLPASVSFKFKRALLEAARTLPDISEDLHIGQSFAISDEMRDDVTDENIVVGAHNHRQLLKECIEKAQTSLVLHSCFLSAATVDSILPDLQRAAERKVRVELIWGLHIDPEEPERRKPISEFEKALNGLPVELRSRVQLAPLSSGSHCKVILYDNPSGSWSTVISSCNFLSSEFDWIDCSVRTNSQKFAAKVLGRILSTQLPASGAWNPMARRLNNHWVSLKKTSAEKVEIGACRLTLLEDDDHYACVTYARDVALRCINLACDLFGLSAETSVLVPMEEASKTDRIIKLFYCRPSRFLRREGREPDVEAIRKRGIDILCTPQFHAKLLSWDTDAIAVTSFNWMSTVVDGARARGAELGILVEGSGVAVRLSEKMREASEGRVNLLD